MNFLVTYFINIINVKLWVQKYAYRLGNIQKYFRNKDMLR